eukprot:253505-Rhodomonas_salina.2
MTRSVSARGTSTHHVTIRQRKAWNGLCQVSPVVCRCLQSGLGGDAWILRASRRATCSSPNAGSPAMRFRAFFSGSRALLLSLSQPVQDLIGRAWIQCVQDTFSKRWMLKFTGRP